MEIIKVIRVVNKVVIVDNDFPISFDATNMSPTKIGSQIKILSIG